MIRLGDVATYINGYAFKPEDRGEEGLPIIRIQDLTGNAHDLGFYNGEYPKKVEINDGDILISWSASLGVYIWSEGKALLNQHIFKVVFDKVAIDKNYFVYAVRRKLVEMGMKTHGATMKHIVKKDFDATLIPYPTLDKQAEIAANLNKVSSIIEAREQELQLLDNLIKARFVELFGDPIKNPKGWDVVKLSECLERIDNGKSFTCDSNAREGAFPAILKLSAATYGDYRPYENKALLDEKQFVESVEVHRGDLLFTRKNTPDLVGMAAYVFETPEKLMMPDLIFRLVTNERMTPIFLWQLINNREFRPVIQGISGGSAKSMSNISKERLKNIEVICPPISEQKKLEGVLDQVDKSKVKVQKALDETQKLFDSLMQQYFG
ncbi:restriction endonuclease subunit S [Blautia massiliensis (ex Durand et al. 2017)]|uniref:restriction endonuclease subunit S n=1 Tax=Blautia massiliensis (ex Durand et al. 2017) TaxID=1737424 RepID=UPI001570D2F1|nr:restriction endonuclease subunit S [Blautia massiliensis (ex Durand et al. 2017)]NSG61095.1 type I restriction endonuclease subunit S [Blautia massiliensis (ex Durand et al. 2017)]NSK94786.1 type I restriction endonuclease subunit S [Blautia massiliensis (ex Durand et al. 2017)]